MWCDRPERARTFTGEPYCTAPGRVWVTTAVPDALLAAVPLGDGGTDYVLDPALLGPVTAY